MITNTLNGKKYIGFTKQPIEKRIKQHQQPSSKCPAIRNAIKKYGWYSFTWEILEESNLTKDIDYLLNVREPYYITKHQPEYNLTLGGDGSSGSKTPKYKTRIPVAQYDSEGKLIKVWSSAKEAGTKLNIIPSSITHVCRGDNGAYFAGGFRWRYATEIDKPLPFAKRKMNMRSVVETMTGKTFDSITDAAKYAKCSKSSMVKKCQMSIEWKYLT